MFVLCRGHVFGVHATNLKFYRIVLAMNTSCVLKMADITINQTVLKKETEGLLLCNCLVLGSFVHLFRKCFA